MKGTKPLTAEEITRLRSHFTGCMRRRNLALFSLGANTGFRVSELLSLTIGDIIDENGDMKDRVAVQKRNTKGKKTGRSQKLNAAAQIGIDPWFKELKRRNIVMADDFIFQSMRKGNKAIDRSQAWRIIKKAARAAAITGKVGTHSWRKTFANNVYSFFLDQVAKGEPVDAFRNTSKALGHTDIKSTDQYLSFLTADIDASVDAVGI